MSRPRATTGRYIPCRARPGAWPCDRPDFAAQTLDLREPRDARPNAVTACISAHGILIIMLADPHLEGVGPGSDQRHVAANNVQKLGKLVDAELTQNAADRVTRGSSRVVVA